MPTDQGDKETKVIPLHSLLNDRSGGILQAQGGKKASSVHSLDDDESDDYGDLPDEALLAVEGLHDVPGSSLDAEGEIDDGSDKDAEGEPEDDEDFLPVLPSLLKESSRPSSLGAVHDYVHSSSLKRKATNNEPVPGKSAKMDDVQNGSHLKKAVDFLPPYRNGKGSQVPTQTLVIDSDPVGEDPALRMRESIKSLQYDKSGLSASPTSTRVSYSDPDQAIAALKTSFPSTDETTIRSLFSAMGGDVPKIASRLRELASFFSSPGMQKPSPDKSTQRSSAGTFMRNEESHSRRQEAKAKSAIYANRQKNVIQSPKSTDRIHVSPIQVEGPQRKKSAGRLKRRQISDDESEEAVESSSTSSSELEEADGLKGPKIAAKASAASDMLVQTLRFFNTASVSELIAMLPIDATQAQMVQNIRPFQNLDDARAKLGKAKGISGRLVDHYEDAIHAYLKVDEVLEEVQHKGAELKAILQAWTGTYEVKSNLLSVTDSAADTAAQESYNAPTHFRAMSTEELVKLPAFLQKAMKDFLQSPPARMSEDLKLKEYQLLGMNWLRVMHKKGLSCILADEMGLGKTAQVIAFMADLLTRDANNRPHLIVVPSSTLENWMREFAKFCPDINVRAYYGNQKERQDLRQDWLYEKSLGVNAMHRLDVAITTYNLATGSIDDRKFLRKYGFRTCVFDEGHMLKNAKSQRYEYLMGLGSHWRLLLTGTPLQNNLQELVSLLNFILPEIFSDALETIQAVFKVRPDSKMALLSQVRVGRAKQMISPFCLRRQKYQVLKDLPKKIERIEYCVMTSRQKSIYIETIKQSRKALELSAQQAEQAKQKSDSRSFAEKDDLKNSGPSSSNVLMDLRKAAIHPMLFRREYVDDALPEMAKAIMREDTYLDAKKELIVEDMTYMTDWELHRLCCKFPKTMKKFMRPPSSWMEAGKILKLRSILPSYKESGERVLIFSQFTSMLDILEAVLDTIGIRWKRIDGQTAVDQRQLIIDEFAEDEACTVFLLSTKAGGLGLNLTMANIVILFDLDYNPHNDAQAEDRAYRLGQDKDVQVIKLITKDSVEESVLALGKTKLALDQSVSGVLQNRPKGTSGVLTPTMSDLWQAPAGPVNGSGDENIEDAAGNAIQSSLMKLLMQKWQDPAFLDELERKDAEDSNDMIKTDLAGSSDEKVKENESSSQNVSICKGSVGARSSPRKKKSGV